MPTLVNAIESVIAREVRDQLAAAQLERMWWVVGGLPGATAVELYEAMTDGSRSDWRPEPTADPIPVFLIEPHSAGRNVANGSSQSMDWDFLVTLRHRYWKCIVIVVPEAANDWPRSIRNASTTLWRPVTVGGPKFLQAGGLPHKVATLVADMIGAPHDRLLDGLKIAIDSGSGLDGDRRDAVPWRVLDAAVQLAGREELSADQKLRAAVGLPLAQDSSLEAAARTLDVLAAYVDEVGLGEAFRELAGTDAARPAAGALAQLQQQIPRVAVSSAEFAQAPVEGFRPTVPPPDWWYTLTKEVLDAALLELGRTPTGYQLRLRVLNALNPDAPRIPAVVSEAVHLQVTGDPPDQNFVRLEVERTNGRGAGPLVVPGPMPSPTQLEQDNLPLHTRPLRYTARERGAKPVTKTVIVLEQFEPTAIAISPSATKISLPKRRRGSSAYEQEITVPHPGTHTLVLYASGTVTSVRDRTTDLIHAVTNHVATLNVEVAGQESVYLECRGHNGDIVRELAVTVAFEEEDETVAPRSLYEALIQAHEKAKEAETPPRAPDVTIRGLEGQLIQSEASWRPVTLCASSSNPAYGIIDWTNPHIGDVELEVDVRPPASELLPTRDVIVARTALLEEIRARGVPISEIDLGETRLRPLIERYVEAYRGWFETNPNTAIWFDVVTVHNARTNIEGGRLEGEHEPTCVLLSPLHPLRLGWFAAAHTLLRESLHGQPVPIAGILSPHTIPDIVSLSLWHGDVNTAQRLFVSVPCAEPHWALLWNSERLQDVQSSQAAEILQRMGLEVQGLAGGFTSGQAQRTMDETERLLPARSTLRVGVVGRGGDSSPAIEGLWRWLAERFPEEDRRLPGAGSVEVYDFRAGGTPDATRIANLADETGERVSWYVQPPGATRFADIVLLDQLGVRNARLSTPPTRMGGGQPARSPIAAGALFRVRIRHDQNHATVIFESRAGTRLSNSNGLEGAIERLVSRMEHEAAERGSHLQFEPNQSAIGQRLANASFISVSSSEIDTACFARGVQGQAAYLWDYDVPIPTGLGDSRPGYYLIARPHDQVKQSVAQALAGISPTHPPIDEVFLEISRRGLPVLKRLANGGNSARGEVGILLAARILQDAFRVGGAPRLRPHDEDTTTFVIPVDPYQRIFDKIRDRLAPESSRHRADFLVVVARDSGPIVITPVEVKFRDLPMSPDDQLQALGQAGTLGSLLSQLWVQAPRSRLWDIGGRAVLAHIVDQAFRLYGDQEIVQMPEEAWARRHERVIRSILEGNMRVCVKAAGKLIVFDNSHETAIEDVDGDGEVDTLRVSASDAGAILRGEAGSVRVGQAVTEFAFASCGEQAAAVVPTAEPSASAESPGGGERSREPASPPVPVALSPPAPPAGALRMAPETITDETAPAAEAERQAHPDAHRLTREVRERVQSVFGDFIGNLPAVQQLQRDLKRALIERPPHLPKNYLLTGPPSTGKTTLARKIAQALQLPFVSLDGRGVQSRDRLFQLIDAALADAHQSPDRQGNRSGKPAFEYPPAVVFVDEAHLMPRAVQESFLTMLESRDRTVMLDDRVAVVPRFTFVFATTRPSELDAAFKTRCTEVQLREYSEEEVAQMLQALFPAMPADILLRLAKLGRGVPRIAIDIARDLDSELVVTDHPNRSFMEHLDEVRRSRSIDQNGVTPQDIDYLRILARHGGPLGEKPIIAAMPGTDADRVVNDIEPFLEKKGFIRKTQRGREITNAGRQYLASYRI